MRSLLVVSGAGNPCLSTLYYQPYRLACCMVHRWRCVPLLLAPPTHGGARCSIFLTTPIERRVNTPLLGVDSTAMLQYFHCMYQGYEAWTLEPEHAMTYTNKCKRINKASNRGFRDRVAGAHITKDSPRSTIV